MTDRRRRPELAVVLLAGLLGGGCGATPAITGTPVGSIPPSILASQAAATIEPSPTPSATPRPTPVATLGQGDPPDDSLPKRASVERDGVRVTIQIGDNPLRSGQRTVIEATIKNTGRDTLHWMVDGCGVNVWPHVDLPGAQWRSSAVATTPQLRAYSTYLQLGARLDLPNRLEFEPGWLFGRRHYGCADLGIPRSLKPGASTTDELIWSGQSRDRLGPPLTSPAVVTAKFARWWRGDAEDAPPNQKPIIVTLDSRVTGGPAPEFLSPAEAIDAALADPAFTQWIITKPFTDDRDVVVEYDPDVNVWMIGMIHDRDNQPSLRHMALVDPLTGKVIAVREDEVSR